MVERKYGLIQVENKLKDLLEGKVGDEEVGNTWAFEGHHNFFEKKTISSDEDNFVHDILYEINTQWEIIVVNAHENKELPRFEKKYIQELLRRITEFKEKTKNRAERTRNRKMGLN